jgi:hypothetical protein
VRVFDTVLAIMIAGAVIVITDSGISTRDSGDRDREAGGLMPVARVPSGSPLLLHPEPLLHATSFTTRRATCPQGGYG